MVNKRGSIEVDGPGMLMTKRSSILNNKCNQGATQHKVKQDFWRFLGVTNFIWLNDTPGLELSDDHIDGTAHFVNGDTIVTHQHEDVIKPTKYNVIVDATDANGQWYKIIHLSLSAFLSTQFCRLPLSLASEKPKQHNLV
jgi:agmatine deiminase